MEQILVKSEMQSDGNILLFYVDDNHEVDPCLLKHEQNDINLQPETKYIIEDNGEGESEDELNIAQATEELVQENWLDEEINRLIVFYNDNKKTFLNGATKNKHLWAVACRTMLTGRNPISCEVKLRMLKKKYIQICLEKQKGNHLYWQYYDVCHHTFHDDSYVQSCLNVISQPNVIINVPVTNIVNEDGIIHVKKVNSTIDENVRAMLNLYIKHKNIFTKHNLPKNIWDTIALELGQEDGEYWHKRFLNFKQHYIRILYKKKELGTETINWPYMNYFNQIFCDDEDFQRRYILNDNHDNSVNNLEPEQSIWYATEQTFLCKYYFDCFHEFQDPTIPNHFLWHEVGRLLNKSPEICQKKLEDLKEEHFKILSNGNYDLSSRVPLEILLDNIISRETETSLTKIPKTLASNDNWLTEQLDELVQYFYDNMVMLKDSICYYVCWATIAKRLNRSLQSCRKQWNDLTKLYKSILNDKKENPDMHIDWRYIDLFDRIFDYGMDTNLLDGYEKLKQINQELGKVGVKKITFKDENMSEDEESYDERGFLKRTKKHTGDEKAFKLLEYYLKNKEKFSSSQHKKLALWEVLGKQIGVSATECAHRFRNFKQVYTAYVQREVNKPEMPILWPYYSLCKKVFGYRAIKSKLKNGKMDNDEVEDWSAKEIKQVINHLANNFNKIVNNTEDETVWSDIAHEMGRPASSLREKFLELRKSYRKLKTMKSRNADVKVSWKYFNMMDNIYTEAEKQRADSNEQIEQDEHKSFEIVGKIEPQDDDDFQCIIVIPEGEEIYYDNEMVAQDENQQDYEIETVIKPRLFKWNKQSKKQLLKLCIDYLQLHKGEGLNSKEMWTEIASKLDDKSSGACKNMFVKLRRNYNSAYGTPYRKLLTKILDLKSKVKRKKCDLSESYLDNKFDYEDVPMTDEKVFKALNYYLQNLEDFVSPKFDKSYLWNELAKHVSEPVNVVFNKINYLKNNYNKDLQFQDILQEILVQENELKYEINKQENLSTEDASEDVWTDLETERLLTWYLAHLDQFKNPTLIRSSLWMEASDILKKSPIVCSKKMTEIRYQYRSMVKENPEELEQWRFHNLCQRIYGTGKRAVSST